MNRIVKYARLTDPEARRDFCSAIRQIQFSDVDAQTGIWISRDQIPIYASPIIMRWLGVSCLEHAEELLYRRRNAPEMCYAREMNRRGVTAYLGIVPTADHSAELTVEVHPKRIEGKHGTLTVMLVKLIAFNELAPNLRGGAG